MSIRPAAVAGSWYPGNAIDLAREVDAHLSLADRPLTGTIVGLIAPHAGLQYSGPIAAHAYRAIAGRDVDVAVLVGPSHFVGFDGVAMYDGRGFETPFGTVAIDAETTAAIVRAGRLIHVSSAPHRREHSLEMQLPFVQRVLPSTPIVPLLMGFQTRDTIEDLAHALVEALANRNAVIVASTDLSHYHDAATAAKLDGKVIELVRRFDTDGMLTALEALPEHACGGGPMAAVMRAASALGASAARILKYGDSGDVSGDKGAVVGYLAAALGTFE